MDFDDIVLAEDGVVAEAGGEVLPAPSHMLALHAFGDFGKGREFVGRGRCGRVPSRYEEVVAPRHELTCDTHFIGTERLLEDGAGYLILYGCVESDQAFGFGLIRNRNACAELEFGEQFGRTAHLQAEPLTLALLEVDVARGVENG